MSRKEIAEFKTVAFRRERQDHRVNFVFLLFCLLFSVVFFFFGFLRQGFSV